MKRKSEIDPTSETWAAVKAYAIERRQHLGLKLESIGNSETDTAVLRGRIAALKDLLALEKDPAEAADERDVPLPQ